MDETVAIDSRQWYAMRVTYQRELAVAESLRQQGIECFVPLTQKLIIRDGRRILKTVAAVANLIFIRMTAEQMKEFKAHTTLPVRYIIDSMNDKPLIVPERQMRLFIEVASHESEDIIYVDPALPKLRAGAKVKVTGGIFAGVEGVFVRIRGDRRVVVTIPGVAAVATHFIHPSLVTPCE